jgi:hypothetical protein
MSLTMYQLTVPPILHGFDVLADYVEKAAAFARARQIDPETILEAKLAPDMLPFIGQIQRASDKSKGGVSRIAGVEAPKFDDNEESFTDLQARIAKTVYFLKNVPVEAFDGADRRVISIKFRSVTGDFSGERYLQSILLPDFYFHIATAHGILRHLGLPIGKADYLGKLAP